MTSSIYREISNFKHRVPQLKDLHRRTKKTFSSIGKDSTFRRYMGSTDDLSEQFATYEPYLQSLFQGPVGIIVLGQTPYAKAVVINEIFRANLIPMQFEPKHSRWRMVRFCYGKKLKISLCLPDENYTVADNLEAYDKEWNTIPMKDLELNPEEKRDSANNAAILEVTYNHLLLKESARVLMAPSCNRDTAEEVVEIFRSCCKDVLPILVYAFQHDELSKNDKFELETLLNLPEEKSFLFVKVPSLDAYNQFCQQRSLLASITSPSHSAAEQIVSSVYSGCHMAARNKPSTTAMVPDNCGTSSNTSVDGDLSGGCCELSTIPSELKLFSELCKLGFLSSMPSRKFPNVREVPPGSDLTQLQMESELIIDFEHHFAKLLLFVRYSLQAHIIRATTMLYACQSQCLDRFILHAYELAYDLMVTPKRLEFARSQELKLYTTLLSKTRDKQDEIGRLIKETLDDVLDVILDEAGEYVFVGVPCDRTLTSREYKICTGQIRELVLRKVNSEVSSRLLGSINVLREAFTGTLQRCLMSLEKDPDDNASTTAFKAMVDTAYAVAVPFKTTSTFVRTLLEKMKELLQYLPWQPGPVLDAAWKRRVANDMLDSLADIRVARDLCEQMSDKIRDAHERFMHSIRRLECRMQERSSIWEEIQDRIRRVYAPHVALLSLDVVSLRDQTLHGMPVLGGEIGRGQYGVVFSCPSWGPHQTLAVKTVVPPDDRHLHDLALELFYTRKLPEHERIVKLKGSVIDLNYVGSGNKAALLIMERMQSDLHHAIKNGLAWPARLQVAKDVIEGIRYLHNQGLIHRDIKLKNVLLDKNKRGKLTDLGFCKPHAMMSGSIVGTPIHMAPELFSGKYECSVDIYAFGILFWYVCSGQVSIPNNFQVCSSKDMLYSAVRKGVRPERLPHFDDACWNLMERCWHSHPAKRPFPGTIEPELDAIFERTKDLPMKAPESLRSTERLKTFRI